MKIQLFFLMMLGLISSSVSAQTKEIAFESHSGSPDNFKRALNNHLFDIDESDFGLPPTVTTYKLDSVIFVSDTIAIVISERFKRDYSEAVKEAKFEKIVHDTVFNHALFIHQHSLDSIKAELRKSNVYSNAKSINSVVFIGFDNKRMKRPVEKKNISPVIFNPAKDNNDPAPGSSINTEFDSERLYIIAVILLLSLLGGWISWKFYQPRLQ
jgi:hypothetical protein